MRFMGKEEFIEEMRAAKEEEKEYVNMADVAKVSEEVKTAVQTGTGKEITRLVEKKRGRKPGSRNKAKTETASWQRHIKDSMTAMISESAIKLEQAKELIKEAEELIDHAAVLGDMVK